MSDQVYKNEGKEKTWQRDFQRLGICISPSWLGYRYEDEDKDVEADIRRIINSPLTSRPRFE